MHLLAGPVEQHFGDVVVTLEEVGIVVPAAHESPASRGEVSVILVCLAAVWTCGKLMAGAVQGCSSAPLPPSPPH